VGNWRNLKRRRKTEMKRNQTLVFRSPRSSLRTHGQLLVWEL
jgi:hypothetical protein